jgi:hypothetical protein
MWLLKPRAECQLKRNLGGTLSRLSWQIPYRSSLVRCRSATAIKLHRTHSLRGHFHREPAMRTLNCSATLHGMEWHYCIAPGTEHSRQKFEKNGFLLKP